MAVMSVSRQAYRDDRCPDIRFASCPRPPVPGKEDDQMPLDCCDPCNRLDILGNSCGGDRADEKLQMQTDVLHQLFSNETTVESCLASKHNTNTKLDTGGSGSTVRYEPNGSAAPVPSASCLKWTEGLDVLLRDSDGVRLFKEFLNQEQHQSSVDFWFACSGLKMIVPADSEKIIGLVKLIYKKYIRGDTLPLRSEVKRCVVGRMKKGPVDQTIFDEAQAEIELSMRNDLYPLFLKSDLYLQYVQTGQESPKRSNNSSGSEPFCQNGGIGNLPTLHEDAELVSNDLKHSSVSSVSLTSSSLLATRKSREGFPGQFYGCAYRSVSGSRLSNPYHISYAPVSAQDSELQSLSSDAQTDDAMSHTDGSIDGREHSGYKNLFRKQMETMRRCAKANQETDVHFIQQFVPRTERVPVDSSLAETDPPRFAGRLIEKLLEVKKEADKMECMKNYLRTIEDPDRDDPLFSLQTRHAYYRPHNNSCDASNNFSLASMLLASTVGSNDDVEDNAQSILDDHVSHVWNSSNATPIRSLGFQTPRRPQHDPVRHPSAVMSRSRGCAGGTSFAPATTHSRAYRRDGRLLPCGVVPVQTSHRHMHHHHHQQLKESYDWPILASESDLALAPNRHLPMLGRSCASWTDVVDAAARSSSARKNLDANNRFGDVSEGRLCEISENGQNDLQRVLMWVLDSEKYCGEGNRNRCSTDGSDKGSSHKRSSHKSANSGSKKNSHHRSNRSESLDRSAFTTDLTSICLSASQMRPAPVVEDGFLVPNASSIPGGHSDESRSRLLQENRQFQTKSRGEMHLEPIIFTQNNNIPFRNLSTSRNIPHPTGALWGQASSDEHLSNAQKSNLTLMTTNSSANDSVTIIGYYFCDEPIPYRMTVPGSTVTLGQFKQLISKKGNYRYFFKKACTEFESGVVHEEISCDNDILPLWEGKIVCKVERIH